MNLTILKLFFSKPTCTKKLYKNFSKAIQDNECEKSAQKQLLKLTVATHIGIIKEEKNVRYL